MKVVFLPYNTHCNKILSTFSVILCYPRLHTHILTVTTNMILPSSIQLSFCFVVFSVLRFFLSCWFYLQVMCTVCGKTFDRKSHLLRHKQGVHLNIRFPCDICGRTFTQVDNLKTHIKTLHMKTTNPVYRIPDLRSQKLNHWYDKCNLFLFVHSLNTGKPKSERLLILMN